ncbi:MAG: Mrp/NBP35 family ATP-binding protein [Gammaproteobacteria bacterium]|nr:Mrp/NBP35 family ATP-binding protein [Gammaproteobacteria bacterium]
MNERKPLKGVKQVIGIASGKGGVGKSTIASSLALALKALDYEVGLLDADIYGPSQGLMMGVPESLKPEIADDQLVPVLAHGVQCMSMSFVTTEKTPMVWRGPMASGALQQLMEQTAWRELDYLIVDMPPGTGDIHLTIAQRLQMSGVLVVTTPQRIAVLDAIKAIEMFRKVETPVLGIVENLSQHRCSACGHEEAVFGSGGGAQLAGDYGLPLLAQLPIDPGLRHQADGADSPLVSDPGSAVSGHFLKLAEQVVKLAREADPSIQVVNLKD